MGLDETGASAIMRAQGDQSGEACMVDQERWAEIRRLFHEERVSISAIGRRLDLDRKTVQRSLRQTTWHPYRRAAVAETLLTAHADFVRTRAPEVGYSARILYQELRASRGYTGSYETVKRCVAPLREVQLQAERALLRFETPPGQQSQIDWGQATVPFRTGPVVVHVFVLTLGFSRRGFYHACADERLAQFLEAHERAFAHFGGHTKCGVKGPHTKCGVKSCLVHALEQIISLMAHPLRLRLPGAPSHLNARSDEPLRAVAIRICMAHGNRPLKMTSLLYVWQFVVKPRNVIDS